MIQKEMADRIVAHARHQGVRRARRDDPDVRRRHDGGQGRRGLVRAAAEDRLDGGQASCRSRTRSRACRSPTRSTTRRSCTRRSASAARRCATRCARVCPTRTRSTRARAATAIDGERRGETLDIAEFGGARARAARPSAAGAGQATVRQRSMPELPEVETVRRTLRPRSARQIPRVWDSGKGLHMQRKPPRAKLRDARRRDDHRRCAGTASTCCVDTDAPTSLLVHLGMTGRVLHPRARRRRAPTHTHVVLDLGDARAAVRRSAPVRPGRRRRRARKERAHPALAVLGPDPLERRHRRRPRSPTRAQRQADHAQGVRARSERDRRGRQHLRVGGAVAREAAPDDARAPADRASARAARRRDPTRCSTNALDNGGTTLSRLRRRRRHRRRERGLSVGLRSRGAALPALQDGDPARGPPRTGNVLLSNVSDPVSGLRPRRCGVGRFARGHR